MIMSEPRPVIFESHLPNNCPRCGTEVIRDHPERPGGITQYCSFCDEHVRVLLGLVPVRLKRCSCGVFTGFNGHAKTTWTCRECKATKFGEEDLNWLKGLRILAERQRRWQRIE